LANWLESYAESLELNIWTSSVVVQASQDATTNRWKVSVRRADGTDRIFNVKHVVFATGMSGIEPNMPKFPGVVRAIVDRACLSRSRISQEKFKGQVLHSTEFKHAKDHVGKKVVVIGACTSGIVGQESTAYSRSIYYQVMTLRRIAITMGLVRCLFGGVNVIKS
jgi:hypothetical protein